MRLSSSKIRVAFRLCFLLLIVIPAAAWFVVKPVRVIATSALGLQCSDELVCVESAAKLAEATALRDEAVKFVQEQVGPLQGNSKVVFCSTQSCADSFGLGLRSAVTVGTAGTVIGPNAWKPYYVRHELIHQLQGQQLGVLHLLFMPGWLIEGMAYALSQDPRSKLAEPWEQDRAQFNAWFAKVGKASLWQEASRL